MIYYSPAWRAPNDGKVESAETILKRLQLLFEHLHDNTHNAIFIDQFNFIDNTPGFEHNTGIIPDEIPHFLTGVASLLQQHTIGYGMWTLRDVPANALRNGLFERNYPSWEWGTSSEIVFDTVGQKKAAQLNQNGILSQRISYCSGVPLVKGMPFQLDFQARCPQGKTVFAVIIRRENQTVYENEMALSGEDWQVLHLDQIPFARGDELKIENRGAPLLVSDFYLYQLRQENGIIDAAGQPKSFYQQLVSLNQQMRSGEKTPLKSFLQREDITPQVLDGVFSDLWMGKILSGLIAWPSNQGSLSFVVKAYVPEPWVDYQNKLTLRLDDQQYQFSQLINKGYNEIRFGPLENTYSDEELFFELESAILVSPKQYDEQSQDGREVSMQLIEIGLIAESQL
jgi:hypothetical protein